MYLTMAKRATCNIFFYQQQEFEDITLFIVACKMRSQDREKRKRERPSLWICSKRSAEKKRSTCSHNGSIVLCIMCLNVSGCV